MLDKCTEIAEILSLEFNVEKCHCIVIGKVYRKEIASMNLCGNNVEWCESIKYLGIYLQSGKYVTFNINFTKRAFYAACNTVLFFFIALELRMI